MMSQPVFLLTALAILLVLVFPIFSRSIRGGSGWTSRRSRRKILFVRIAVAVLAISPLFVIFLPLGAVNRLLLASLISVVVLVPAWFICTRLIYRKEVSNNPSSAKHVVDTLALETSQSHDNASPDVIVPPVRHPLNDQVLSGRIGSTTAPQGLSSALSRSRDDAKPEQASRNAVESLRGLDELDPLADEPKAVDLDATSVTIGALASASSLIDSHELDNDFTLHDTTDGSEAKSDKVIDRTSEITRLAQADYSNTDLTKLDSSEIGQLVSTLRKDKLRLQKLVIAQQATITSERKTHERSQEVAKDALKIMQEAKAGQKLAQKVARRERAHRKNLETQYAQVRRALANAVSVIEARESTAQKPSSTRA